VTDIYVHEWLSKGQYSRWICPHMRVLLDALALRGYGIKAIGLANYRAPGAIIFVEQPLHEPTVRVIVEADPALKFEYNGIGALHAVYCSEHAVTARYSRQPG
jgi:hypothetical protein